MMAKNKINNKLLATIDVENMTSEEKERLAFYNNGINITKAKLTISIIRSLSTKRELSSNDKQNIKNDVNAFADLLFGMSLAEKCTFKTYDANMLVGEFMKKQDPSTYRLAVLTANNIEENPLLVHSIMKKYMPEQTNADIDNIDIQKLKDKIEETLQKNINNSTNKIAKKYLQNSDNIGENQNLVKNDIRKLLKHYTNSKVQCECIKENFKSKYGFGGYLVLSYEQEMMEYVNGKTSIISRQPRKINTKTSDKNNNKSL